MYQIKIAILCKNHIGDKFWKTVWLCHDNPNDNSILHDVENQERKEIKQFGVRNTVVDSFIQRSIDCTEGKYFCGSCECYFDDFDKDTGNKCCPYCASGNYVEGGPDDIVTEFDLVEKECENLCPKCDSEDISWGTKDIASDYSFMKQPAVCNKCGTEFEEYFNINYVSTEYNVPAKKEKG